MSDINLSFEQTVIGFKGIRSKNFKTISALGALTTAGAIATLFKNAATEQQIQAVAAGLVVTAFASSIKWLKDSKTIQFYINNNCPKL